MKNKFFPILISSVLLLSSCSLFDGGKKSSDPSDINTFEFVTDASLIYKDDGSNPYYLLTMYVDDEYQIRTTIDNKLEDKYQLTYENADETIYTVSSTGLVTAIGKGVKSFWVNLLRKSDSKKLARKYIIINVKVPTQEHANITLTDESMTYDSATRTYSLTLESGTSYPIRYSVDYNVAFGKKFELSNTEYSSFMSVSSGGVISSEKLSESKDGQVTIQTISTDGKKVYDTVYLNVHLTPSTVVHSFEVSVNETGQKIKDQDKLTLHLGDTLSFLIQYDSSSLHDVMSVTNINVLTLDNSTNKITGKAIGKSNVAFTYLNQSITIEVEVINDPLVEIYTKNGGDDLIVVNDTVQYLGNMLAKYASGRESDITKSENLTYVIRDKDATYKTVTFTYTSEGESKSVSYDVRFFNPETYIENTTAYTLADYFNNHHSGRYYPLPKEGTVHMLVIPVWFTNSTSFFNTDQKEEIIADLDYVFNADRSGNECYSVKSFYETESKGKLKLNITISDFYESNTSSKVYGDTVQTDINKTHSLADSAINWYFNKNTNESISDYDANNDGLVDAVTLLYAANYYGTIGDQNGTTAFQFKNTEGSSHRYNNGSFSPIGGIYGFNKNSTTMGKDVKDLSSYYPSYYFLTGAKTIIHETGHMFGMDDLYEDNHAQTKYYPAGRFTMQASDLGGHDPYQMNLVGWSKPQIYDASNYEIGDEVVVKIEDFITTGNNILLTREMNEHNSLFDEYMLLELLDNVGLNYYQGSFNTNVSFSDPGIRLWHVNSILEDYTTKNDTTEINDNHVVNLKYSNYDQSSEYDLLHWIRNNPEEPYNTVSTVKNSYGLFKSGDSFDMDTYKSQFVNNGLLDNKEKLGWEFTVNSIYTTSSEKACAIITLKRVDNTRTDFDISTRLDKDITTQPTSDGNDYATTFFGNDDLFSLIYNFNDAVEPSYYTQGKPISYRGLCLFAATSGNGGSLVIRIKEKEGYKVLINSISITSTALTNAPLTAIVNGNEITGTSFEGPFNELDNYNELGKTFIVNNDTVTIQNKYTNETLDHHSVLALYSLSINYHLEKI